MPSPHRRRSLQLSQTDAMEDVPAGPIVLSDTFPVPCDANLRVSLVESGLLSDSSPRLEPRPTPASSAPPANRTTSVDMPAARPELPERSTIRADVTTIELPLAGPHALRSADQSRSARRAAGNERDPRLAQVIDAWPLLPPTLQSTILALVRSVIGK